MTTPLRERTRQYILHVQHQSKVWKLKYFSERGGLLGEVHKLQAENKQLRAKVRELEERVDGQTAK
jgi:hypothetical protein